MRIDLRGDPLVIEKEDSVYDAFVRDFLGLWPLGWREVIVSGYVALLFGRERMTEDIDMLVDQPTPQQFKALWTAMDGAGFWCLQTGNPATALVGCN